MGRIRDAMGKTRVTEPDSDTGHNFGDQYDGATQAHLVVTNRDGFVVDPNAPIRQAALVAAAGSNPRMKTITPRAAEDQIRKLSLSPQAQQLVNWYRDQTGGAQLSELDKSDPEVQAALALQREMRAGSRGAQVSPSVDNTRGFMRRVIEVLFPPIEGMDRPNNIL